MPKGKKPSHLKRFFAVTLTSIYEVTCADKSMAPIAKKIALRDSSDIILGEILKHGTMLSVGQNLWMFTPEKYGFSHPMTEYERDLAKVPNQWWGGHSSYVVALFLKKEDAEKCLAARSGTICDARWLEQSKEVLRAIGDNHPNFSLPTTPDLWLMSPTVWRK